MRRWWGVLEVPRRPSPAGRSPTRARGRSVGRGLLPAWGSAGQRTGRAALLSLGMLFPFLFHAFLFCLSYHLLFFYFFLAPPLFFSPLFSFLSFSFPFFLSPFFLHFFATLFLSFPLSFPLPPFFFLHSFHFSLLSYLFFIFPPSPQLFPLSPLLPPLFPSPFFTLPPPALTSPRAGQGRDRAEQPGEAGNLQVAPGMGEGGGGGHRLSSHLPGPGVQNAFLLSPERALLFAKQAARKPSTCDLPYGFLQPELCCCQPSACTVSARTAGAGPCSDRF